LIVSRMVRIWIQLGTHSRHIILILSIWVLQTDNKISTENKIIHNIQFYYYIRHSNSNWNRKSNAKLISRHISIYKMALLLYLIFDSDLCYIFYIRIQCIPNIGFVVLYCFDPYVLYCLPPQKNLIIIIVNYLYMELISLLALYLQ